MKTALSSSLRTLLGFVSLTTCAACGSWFEANMPPDASGTAAPCRAAQGLSGSPVFCIDFSSTTDIAKLNNEGWLLAWQNNGCNGFKVTDYLTNINSQPAGSPCGFLLPPIPDTLSFQKLSVSIIHSAKLNKSQKVQIQPTTQSTCSSGECIIINDLGPGENRTVGTFNHSTNSHFQFGFKLIDSDTNPNPFPSWQISSLAVLAN